MFYSISKRLFDAAIAGLALVLFSPLLIPIAIALRFTGEREVLYRQERLGLGNRPFSILKFATMLKNSPNMAGGEITLRGDPRITTVGAWLRRTKINELPQLVNVLLGQMSLVGPRPLMKVSFLLYSDEVQKIVYQSKPGLTGIASLVFRDEEWLVTNSGVEPRLYYRTVIYPYKGQLESWYFQHKSFWVDLQILLLTPWYILLPKTQMAFKIFPDLPVTPESIRSATARIVFANATKKKAASKIEAAPKPRA